MGFKEVKINNEYNKCTFIQMKGAQGFFINKKALGKHVQKPI
jgi:hypothetical protein